MDDVTVSKHFNTSPNNLPLQVNRFIGREREMTAVRGLLATTRLLTLTGAGGSDKTRLALQVATDLLEEFAHGVWWVELAALSDPLLVPQAVASALGIPERAGCTVTEALSDALRPKHVLLVLDNCEHLLAACVQLIETLLRTCSQLRVLVTSREALTITGETIWLVLPLRVPDTYQPPPIEGLLTYEAVQLFVERALSALPSRSHQRTHQQWCRCVAGSTACHWRLSWPRPVYAPSLWSRSSRDSMMPIGYSPVAVGRPYHGSKPCGRPWTGAITCCRHMNRPSSVGSRCLLAVFRSKRQRPSAQVSQMTRTRCSISSLP